LSEKLKYEVMSKEPSTIDAAMAIATQYEPLHARPAAEVNTIRAMRVERQVT
jgi:hypothetical protein